MKKALFGIAVCLTLFSLVLAGCDDLMELTSDKNVTGVSLDHDTLEVGIGKQKTLTATVRPQDAENKGVTWRTDNRNVATVSSSGRVTGVAPGTATITVTTDDGGYTDACEVTVTANGGGSDQVPGTQKTTFTVTNIPSDIMGQNYIFAVFRSDTGLEDLLYVSPEAQGTGTITGSILTGDIYSEGTLSGSYIGVVIVGSEEDPYYVGYSPITIAGGIASIDISNFRDVTDEYMRLRPPDNPNSGGGLADAADWTQSQWSDWFDAHPASNTANLSAVQEFTAANTTWIANHSWWTSLYSAWALGGGGGGGGSIPAELAGTWYSSISGEALFEFQEDGVFVLIGNAGNPQNYDASVEGSTVTVYMNGAEFASFMYSISNGELTMSSATSIFAALANHGPFTQDGSSGGGGGNGGDGTALETVTAISAYLAAAGGGSAAGSPVPVTAALDLSSSSVVTSLLSAIDDAGKYVALDLSECTSGAEFDVWGMNSPWIVSLILPATATTVETKTNSEENRILKTIRGDAIVTIKTQAFQNYTALETVNFPLAVSIGGRAFYQCTALTTADFPKATSIGDYAFYQCTALTTVNFPLAVSIGGRAFYQCTALTTADFPKATSIGDYAFYQCTALETADFPKAETIGASAFNQCTALTTADFPKATSIGEKAFYRCDALKTVDFLPKATSIGDFAFYMCKILKTANFPQAASIGTGAFDWCEALTTVNFPQAVSIGTRAFERCTALTTANFPQAASIGDAAFEWCTALTTADFPKATSIGKRAFFCCNALETADFPKVETIGMYAFSETGAKALTITLPRAAPEISNEAYSNPKGYSKTVTIKTPSGRTGYDAEWEANFKKALGSSEATITLIFE
jgi:hypothetical protein